MAVNHYSADSALRSLPSLNTPPAKAGSGTSLEITRSPFAISEVPVPASYVLANNASAYFGRADSSCWLAEHTGRHAEPSLTRTFPNQTSID